MKQPKTLRISRVDPCRADGDEDAVEDDVIERHEDTREPVERVADAARDALSDHMVRRRLKEADDHHQTLREDEEAQPRLVADVWQLRGHRGREVAQREVGAARKPQSATIY